MAWKAFSWKNKAESSPTALNKSNLQAAETAMQQNIIDSGRSEVFHGYPASTRIASLTFAGNGGTQLSDGVKEGETSIIKCKAVRNCGGFRLVFGNWSKSGEREPSNSIIVQAGIERADKTILPANFRSSESVTIGRGCIAVSDILPFEAKEGDEFFVRTYVSVAKAGEKWPLDRTTVATNGEGVSPTNVNKSKNAEAITATSGVCYSPVNIVAVSPSNPVQVIAQVGDSIISGQADVPVDLGWFNRGLNSKYAYVNVGKGGDTAQKFAEGVASESRMQMIDACTHAVVAYGVNDLGVPRTVAQIKADLETIYTRLSLRGIKVYGCTITPKPTSTDGFVTVENQTIGAHNTEAQELNTWLRTIPAPLTGLIDVAWAVESSHGSGKWAANLTQEGTHPVQLGHETIAAAFNPAVLFV